MSLVNCKICEKEFYAKPNWLKKGWGIYCSNKCQYKAQLKGKFVSCTVCRKKIWRKPRDLKRSKSGKFFCNKAHHMAWKNKVFQVGEFHPNWAGGEFASRRILKQVNRKTICTSCGIADKRVLVIHHKDKDRKNNKAENLIWLCQNCHCLVHYHNKKA